MTKTWKVSWNSKLYNYKKLISDFKNNINSGIIYQSKGRAIMKNLPQINDIVHISCNKQHIMTCIVLTNFIIGGVEQVKDEYNIGDQLDRLHSSNNTYLTMKIINIYENPVYLRGCQRTWCTYRN